MAEKEHKKELSGSKSDQQETRGHWQAIFSSMLGSPLPAESALPSAWLVSLVPIERQKQLRAV